MRTDTFYRRTQQNRRLIEQALLTVWTGGLLFLLSIAVILLGSQLFSLGAVHSGVSVGGVDLGGLNRDDALDKLAREWTYPQTGRILLTHGDQTWTVTPEQMGLYVDLESSVDNAYNLGRGQGLFANVSAQFNASLYGAKLAPVLLFDQRMAANYLSGLAAQIDTPVHEPSISINGADVVVQPGQAGRYLDLQQTLGLITAQIQTQLDGVVPLAVVEVDPSVADVSQQAEQARNILSAPLALVMPPDQPDTKGPWTFEPADLAKMLVFERVQQGNTATYELALNRPAMAAYLQSIADGLALSPQNPRFMFNDDTRQLEVLQPSITGRALNIDASVEDIEKRLLAGEHNMALTFVFSPPAVTSDMTGEQLGITELVHEDASYFYGSSADRVQNIQTAAAEFHGLLVPPHSTFSMASAMGDITLDNGYAEALIIVGDQTIKGVGGGVCQVSTTLFRAAFFAGFPIVERHPHAYRVYYYEKIAGGGINPSFAGLDATVFVPLVDFKFTNDTDHWLLMETYVNPSYSSIVWKFYSTGDGRTVDWNTTGLQNVVEAPDPLYTENPELASGEVRQVDWAADGADVTISRTVYRDGQVYLEDHFSTHYEAWQEKWEYGPGTEGMPPEPEPEGEPAEG